VAPAVFAAGGALGALEAKEQIPELVKLLQDSVSLSARATVG